MMASVFWDRKGVLMLEFMQTWDHNNVRSVLLNTKKLHKAGHSEQKCGMLRSGVMLLHDNAHLDKAARTRALLQHFNWELFHQPPYSPDLAPSNYHLFTYLKKWLGSQRFNNNEELMEHVKT
jgi:histone-lysine N-methyltransferase SETMAR